MANCGCGKSDQLELHEAGDVSGYPGPVTLTSAVIVTGRRLTGNIARLRASIKSRVRGRTAAQRAAPGLTGPTVEPAPRPTQPWPWSLAFFYAVAGSQVTGSQGQSCACLRIASFYGGWNAWTLKPVAAIVLCRGRGSFWLDGWGR